jgi:hypothetical protein
MKKVILFVIGLAIAFTIGVLGWRTLHPGQRLNQHESASSILNGGRQAASDTDATVVLVDNHPISEGDLAWEIDFVTKSHLNGQKFNHDIDMEKDTPTEIQATENLRSRLLTALVERKLLYAYIKRKGDFDLNDPSKYVACLTTWQNTIKDASQDILKYKDQLKAKLCEDDLVQQYFAANVVGQVEVSESEIKSFYSRNPSKFDRQTEVVFRQIVLPNEGIAKTIRSQVNSSNFAEIARERSISPEKIHGGLLGPIKKGVYPVYFDVLFTMRTGEITDIIKSPYGFHIMMLVKKINARRLTLEEARPEIKQTILNSKKAELFQRWVNSAMNVISVVPKHESDR